MAVSLNHTIVHARDSDASAAFLAGMMNLPAPSTLGPFVVVQVGETSLDFLQTDEVIHPNHFAFLVSEEEFSTIFDRIRAAGLRYWADPFHQQPGQINHWDDGRGVYFDDPNGHILEILTRPYGSGGLDAAHPNPLLLS
ncbi:VOC family protein [Sphingobium aromaticiconvertens]|uniref:VOC family protein n=1 Tax=Sphingobium aromaticiconvertens TaxID=365341 RepID=UPI0030166A1A